MQESRTISFANQKGGVGKTTCVSNLGCALALQGYSVALIDLDPQAHLTASFGYNPDEIDSDSICDVMRGEKEVEFLTPKSGHGLLLMPSNLSLAGMELQLSEVPGRELVLKSFLSRVDVDYILIDCPPSLGVLTLNALTASQDIIIPMPAEYLPFRGVAGLLQTVELVRDRLNPELSVEGVVITRYDGRKKLSQSVTDKISAFFGDKAFKTEIRENVSVAEAPAYGLSIFDYAPDSHGAIDFENLAIELLGRYGEASE